jgi:ubiquinone/menaquinone biosynthesis C-methylase UbiE
LERFMNAMPDPYAEITQATPEMLDAIANALEIKGADPQHVAFADKYFQQMQLMSGTKVLEGGCGTGPIARQLASFSESSNVVGLDPSPQFIEKAKELSADYANVAFEVGDARAMPFEDGSFDAVVFHTYLATCPMLRRPLPKRIAS